MEWTTEGLFTAGTGILSLRHRVQRLGPSQPRTQGFFPLGSKESWVRIWPLPSSTEVDVWSYTSTPPYIFMDWCLVKYRDNFTFHLQWHDVYRSVISKVLWRYRRT